jgi:aubergine-like protein
LLENFSIANQVVCSATISAGKNLVSIVTKIAIQIQAKMGGIPWSIQVDDLTKFRRPTMVIGYDVFHKKKQGSVMAFNATMDINFCKYWSTLEFMTEVQEFCTTL